MTPLPTSLTLLMTTRAWWQQGRTVTLVAAIAGVLLGAGTLLLQSGVNGLPEDLPASVMNLARLTHQGQLLEVNTFMVAMTPVLLSLLSALLATMITPSIVSEDVRGGLLEVLLTTPLGRGRIFRAYLGAAVLLTLLCWGLCSIALGGSWAVLTTTFPLQLHLSPSLLWLLLVLPLSMTLWAASVTLCGSLLFPASLDPSSGINGGPVRLVALTPIIVLLPAVIMASEHLPLLLLGSLTLTLLTSLLLIWLTARQFRNTVVLE